VTSGKDVDNGGNITPQTYPASITLKTDPTNHWLTGLVNPQTGVACFANEPLTIFNWGPGQPQGESFAMGQAFDIFAQDSLGNYIYMTGYSVSDNGGPAEQYEWSSYPPSTGNGPYGTNKTYVILFSISGGPCDQWEGADKPFTIVGEGITTATMATTRTGTAGTEAASEREGIHPKPGRTSS